MQIFQDLPATSPYHMQQVDLEGAAQVAIT